MEITISKTSENPFLQRKEVHGKVSFQGATPSQKQLADALATKLGAKADAIFVAHVFTNFGAQCAEFEAHVYAGKEQLEKVVRLGKKAKEKAAKAALAPAVAAADQPALPAAAPAAEAKPAEAPKEEKKEEPKAEKKAEEKKEAPKPEAKKVEPKAEKKEAPKPEAAKPEEKREAAKA